MQAGIQAAVDAAVTMSTTAGPATVNPRTVLQNAVLWIGLPVAAFFLIMAGRAGKGGAIIGIILGVLLALAFAFGNVETWKAVGGAVAMGIEAMLKW